MKLLNLRTQQGVHLGVRLPVGVLDLTAVAQGREKVMPSSTDELMAMGPVGWQEVYAFLQEVESSSQLENLIHEESEVTFAPSVIWPEKILCIGTNYRKHALESNMPIPNSPVVFSKFSNSLAAHNQEVVVPAVTEKLDYEVELVVVIGKTVVNVDPEQALSYVFGYCTGNDLSARDLQMRTSQWLLGKSLDGFAPLGPYLVTADEVADPNQLKLECRVNGQIRQSSNTRDMIFDCAELISYLSKHMTLNPGDVIYTGTPEGVILGYPAERQQWLKPGDEVVVEVEGLGQLRTPLI